jgi:hypothetical protein
VQQVSSQRKRVTFLSTQNALTHRCFLRVDVVRTVPWMATMLQYLHMVKRALERRSLSQVVASGMKTVVSFPESCRICSASSRGYVISRSLVTRGRAPRKQPYACLRRAKLWVLFTRCFHETRCHGQRTDQQFSIYISYLEIYNEAGYDLLDPSQDTKALEELPYEPR